MAELASRRHGEVTRGELLAAGFTSRVIGRLIAKGVLVPVHPGVYLVGLGPPAPRALEAAAIAACQPRAFLSHGTAAHLHRLTTRVNNGIHVTVAGRWRRDLNGVHVHSINRVLPAEVNRHEGLPLSSPSLTLLDLAGVVGTTDLSKALNEARVLRLANDGQLCATLDTHPSRRGARALRKVLDSEQGPGITRSEAERRALLVMRRHGIEPDASDFRIGPYRVDFWFERERVAVEVDGYRYHGTPKRFVDDRRRTAYLAARSVQVYPLTWHDLGSGAARAMADLKRTLAARGR